MRKALIVLVLAGVLILALSVPALAGPTTSTPNAWGQIHKAHNSWWPPGGAANPEADENFPYPWSDVVHSMQTDAAGYDINLGTYINLLKTIM